MTAVLRTQETSDDAAPPWRPYELGARTGFVIVLRSLGTGRCGEDWPGEYWCGDAAPGCVVDRLEYLNFRTRQLTPARIAVYDRAWDAVSAWARHLGDVHRADDRPHQYAMEVRPLSLIADRQSVPPPVCCPAAAAVP